MNAKEIIGLKIIDKNANDVAKITEFNFNIKTFEITGIVASSGNPLSKKYYEISPKNIIALGNYLLIDIDMDDLKQYDKMPKTDENNIRVNDSIGKTVLDSNGNVAGKIDNINLDFEKYEVSGLSFSKSSSFGKPKENNEISKEDIISFGDYLIISQSACETKEEDLEEDDDSEEKMKVNID